jgi:hypothetical protein
MSTVKPEVKPAIPSDPNFEYKDLVGKTNQTRSVARQNYGKDGQTLDWFALHPEQKRPEEQQS